MNNTLAVIAVLSCNIELIAVHSENDQIMLTQSSVIHKMQHILHVTPITDTESADMQMMNLHKIQLAGIAA